MKDRRKHCTQMNQEEISLLVQTIKTKNSFSIDSYTEKRMYERNIPKQYFAKILSSEFEIIEAHNNEPSEIRVLIRGKIYDDSLCFVVSLQQAKIITCYWNDSNDQHKTLDKTQYQWNVNILDVLGANNCEHCQDLTSNKSVCLNCILKAEEIRKDN